MVSSVELGSSPLSSSVFHHVDGRAAIRTGRDPDFVHVRFDDLQTPAALVDGPELLAAGTGLGDVEPLAVVGDPDVDARVALAL
jgi:hypothetical protein